MSGFTRTPAQQELVDIQSDIEARHPEYKTSTSIDPDEVSVHIGSRRIVGWESVSITRSVELFPKPLSADRSRSLRRRCLARDCHSRHAGRDDQSVYR
jgi:hypothetical protein